LDKKQLIATVLIFLAGIAIGFPVAWFTKPIPPTGPGVGPEQPVTPYLNYLEYSPNLEMPPSNYTGKLRVYTWAGYDDPCFWDVGEYAFHKMYPNVEVEWISYESPDAAIAKLKADPTFADIIVGYSDTVMRMYLAGVIEPIDLNLLPLYDELYPGLMGLEQAWINGECYFAPFEFGYTSVIYRADLLRELGIPEELWNDLNLIFDPSLTNGKLEGKVWLYDWAAETMTLAARAAGFSYEELYNITGEKLEIVKQKLIEAKPNVAHYWTGWEEGYMALITGEAVAVIGWQDTFYWAKKGLDGEIGTEDDVDVEFMWAKQGWTTWVGGYSIVKGLKERNPELYKIAHALITATQSRETQVNKIDLWAYGAANRYAIELAENEEFIEYFHLESPSLKEVSKYNPYNPEWNEVWLEVRGG